MTKWTQFLFTLPLKEPIRCRELFLVLLQSGKFAAMTNCNGFYEYLRILFPIRSADVAGARGGRECACVSRLRGNAFTIMRSFVYSAASAE